MNTSLAFRWHIRQHHGHRVSTFSGSFNDEGLPHLRLLTHKTSAHVSH
jgi:hypothetical protein